jgi:aminoglycoside phosphotransferase family enzyme/predicted kinase
MHDEHEEPDPQAAVIAFLQQGDAFGEATPPRRIDTHAASIFLTGHRAWKLKRAVRFGYLDFSTADRRRAALEAELSLNRRTAPALYRAVHPITRADDGRLAIDGRGAAVDWLLEMRRFPDDALLDRRADLGLLDASLLARLADRIAAFHDEAAVASPGDGAARLRRVIDGTITSMAAFPAILDPEQARQAGARLLVLAAENAALLDARGREGRIRRGHGDLHLANIALIEGEPTMFDCLEFSTELATTDVLYDLAFLLMDLWFRERHTAANSVFNRYLDRSAADEDGVALLPLFLALRATIRAHALAARSERADSDAVVAHEAQRYLALALATLQPVPPRLVAIGGLSGTGKSSVARLVGGAVGRAPGARIFRNDVLRKRLVGVAPEAPLPRTHYTEAAAARVYRETGALATAALAAGQAVLVDAVFAQPDERRRIEAVATRAGVPFRGLWLEASDTVRLARVAARRGDASDADAAVARAQAAVPVGDLGGWRRVSATGPLEAVAARVRLAAGPD